MFTWTHKSVLVSVIRVSICHRLTIWYPAGRAVSIRHVGVEVFSSYGYSGIRVYSRQDHPERPRDSNEADIRKWRPELVKNVLTKVTDVVNTFAWRPLLFRKLPTFYFLGPWNPLRCVIARIFNFGKSEVNIHYDDCCPDALQQYPRSVYLSRRAVTSD